MYNLRSVFLSTTRGADYTKDVTNRCTFRKWSRCSSVSKERSASCPFRIEPLTLFLAKRHMQHLWWRRSETVCNTSGVIRFSPLHLLHQRCCITLRSPHAAFLHRRCIALPTLRFALLPIRCIEDVTCAQPPFYFFSIRSFFTPKVYCTTPQRFTSSFLCEARCTGTRCKKDDDARSVLCNALRRMGVKRGGAPHRSLHLLYTFGVSHSLFYIFFTRGVYNLRTLRETLRWYASKMRKGLSLLIESLRCTWSHPSPKGTGRDERCKERCMQEPSGREGCIAKVYCISVEWLEFLGYASYCYAFFIRPIPYGLKEVRQSVYIVGDTIQDEQMIKHETKEQIKMLVSPDDQVHWR